jgi:hypothetical protein
MVLGDSWLAEQLNGVSYYITNNYNAAVGTAPVFYHHHWHFCSQASKICRNSGNVLSVSVTCGSESFISRHQLWVIQNHLRPLHSSCILLNASSSKPSLKGRVLGHSYRIETISFWASQPPLSARVHLPVFHLCFSELGDEGGANMQGSELLVRGRLSSFILWRLWLDKMKLTNSFRNRTADPWDAK